MDNKPRTLSGDKEAEPNGASDPARQRAEIAQTRNEMSATIEELHGRLNPTVLKEQALEQFHEATETVKEDLKVRLQEAKEAVMEEIDTVKARVSDEIVQAKAALREATIGKVENMMHEAKDRVRVAGRNVREVVTDNPVPAALAALGLAWLFVEGRRRRTSGLIERPRRQIEGEISTMPRIEEGEEGRERSVGRRVRDVAQQAGEKVSGATHEAASAVTRYAQEAKESVSEVAHKAKDRATEVSQQARRQARRVQRRGSELFRDNPIAIGAAMLAAGTILGLAVPRTEIEDEYLGSAKDNVMGKAKALAHEAFGKADEAVKRIGTDEDRSASATSESGQQPGDQYH